MPEIQRSALLVGEARIGDEIRLTVGIAGLRWRARAHLSSEGGEVLVLFKSGAYASATIAGGDTHAATSVVLEGSSSWGDFEDGVLILVMDGGAKTVALKPVSAMCAVAE